MKFRGSTPAEQKQQYIPSSFKTENISSIHSLSQFLETEKEKEEQQKTQLPIPEIRTTFQPQNPYKTEIFSKPNRSFSTQHKYVFYQNCLQFGEANTSYMIFPFDGVRFNLVDALLCGDFFKGSSVSLLNSSGEQISKYLIQQDCKVFRWDFSLETQALKELTKLSISCMGPASEIQLPEDEEPRDTVRMPISQIVSIELNMAEKNV